ncbi:MAG TPA: YkgJ family cysteine cluster protein [Pyrinomonadaceae bacterium]
MNETSHKSDELLKIFEDLNFGAVCPDCQGQCCQMPWLNDDERHLARRFPEATKFIDGTAFFLNHNRCAFLDRQTGKCRIYDARPLDCRLFPLDIIEEDGEYYWCVFTTCPNWQKMRELLEPCIPLLENKIDSSLWRQFCKQIAVTKEEYPPYKNRQYVIVKRFGGGFKEL